MTSRDRRRTSAKHDHVRDDVRAGIANLAARLIAEGLTDYQAAKQKAARQLGAGDKLSLPDNHEIDAALREHLALFQSDTQPRALRELRQAALRAMQRLERFAPWITGAVLNGTANEFSEIELELVAIDPKVFELFLLNEGVAFAVHTRNDRVHARIATCYALEFEELPVTVMLFDTHAQRLAVAPRGSLRRERAQRLEAEIIFAGNGAVNR